MIEAKHPGLNVKRQCELLELPRSTYYHRRSRSRTRTSR